MGRLCILLSLVPLLAAGQCSGDTEGTVSIRMVNNDSTEVHLWVSEAGHVTEPGMEGVEEMGPTNKVLPGEYRDHFAGIKEGHTPRFEVSAGRNSQTLASVYCSFDLARNDEQTDQWVEVVWTGEFTGCTDSLGPPAQD